MKPAFVKPALLILGVAAILSAAPQDTPKGIQRTLGETRPQKGASFDEDMRAENLRHADRLTDLFQRGVTIETELSNELIRCRADQACRQRAIEDYRKKKDELQIDRNNENATFEKNRADIVRNWRDNRGAGPGQGARSGLPAPAIARNPPTRWENGGVQVQLQTGEWVQGMPIRDGWLVWYKGDWVPANK